VSTSEVVIHKVQTYRMYAAPRYAKPGVYAELPRGLATEEKEAAIERRTLWACSESKASFGLTTTPMDIANLMAYFSGKRLPEITPASIRTKWTSKRAQSA
jgi:hypothetical protein